MKKPRDFARRELRHPLELTPQFQQMFAVAVKFTSQTRGGDALEDAAEDEEDLRRGTMRVGQEGARPGVEDTATVAALVVEHGGAVAAVDAQPVLMLPAWASQPGRVKHRQEVVVTRLLIQQIHNRKIHRLPPPPSSLRALLRPPILRPPPSRVNRQAPLSPHEPCTSSGLAGA